MKATTYRDIVPITKILHTVNHKGLSDKATYWVLANGGIYKFVCDSIGAPYNNRNTEYRLVKCAGQRHMLQMTSTSLSVWSQWGNSFFLEECTEEELMEVLL